MQARLHVLAPTRNLGPTKSNPWRWVTFILSHGLTKLSMRVRYNVRSSIAGFLLITLKIIKRKLGIK